MLLAALKGRRLLLGLLRRKVKVCILFGAAREKIHVAMSRTTAAIEVVPTLNDAVELAARSAKRGNTVLLSPGCMSLDQFEDYAERGNLFQQLVRAL